MGCGRRRETRFVFFCVAPQVACRQRSHAQIATSVLQSLFCTHSTWRRSRCNIKSQGGVFRTHSRWRRLLLWLRPSTGDTLRLLPRRAVGRLQTEISPADCDFSLALVVLHTFDMASLALQHQKVRGSFSHWRQEAPVCLNWQLCFFTLVFCFRFLAGSKAGERRPQSRPTSRPGLLLPAALLSEVSWLHLCSCVLETSLLHSLFCTRSTWRRSRCNIKRSGGLSLSSAKRLLCA